MRSLMWFRVDLRARDNRALAAAARESDRGVVGVFLLAPQMWRDHDESPNKIDFVRRNLEALSETLRERSIALLIRTAPRAKDAAGTLLDVIREHECDALYFNDQYEVNEQRRDDDVESRVRKAGVEVRRFMDQTILDPRSFRTGSGSHYTVYTPYRKAWESAYAERDDEAKVEQLCAAQSSMVGTPDTVPARVDGFDPTIDTGLWQAGEDHAKSRLRAFAQDRIGEYASKRDLPDHNGTSTLSPYLASGVLSPRQCLKAALDVNDGRLTSGRKGVTTWIGELVWREFYRHFLLGFPRVSMHEAFKRDVDRRVEWRYDEPDFEAWKAGETGYPLVDAGMRQLSQTGWMHNRLRMVVAMFLTKHMLIDWRWGERWFMQNLVDGDLAQNNGGWQWSASTGADAAPYFRIFNPTTQSERFDPDGAFIRRYVASLEQLDAKTIHDPPELVRERVGYSQRIVEHKPARERALAAFKER